MLFYYIFILINLFKNVEASKRKKKSRKFIKNQEENVKSKNIPGASPSTRRTM